MSTTVGEMSKEELRQMLETIVDQKLMEFLGEPDAGLELREEIQERLTRQMHAVAAGERGMSLEDFKQEFRTE